MMYFLIEHILKQLADFISQIGISKSGYEVNGILCRFISQRARYGSTSYPRARYFTIPLAELFHFSLAPLCRHRKQKLTLYVLSGYNSYKVTGEQN